MLNKMYSKLLKEGFSRKTLSTLSEKQISVLFKKIISEQGSAVEKLQQLPPEIEKVKKGLSDIQNQVSGLVGEDELDDTNALGAMAMQGDTGQDMPHDEDDMAPDGADDDSDNDRKMMADGELEEKSVSKKQQKFMGMVYGLKKGDVKPSEVSKQVKDAAKGMSEKEAKKFASTKHKGLPTKVDESYENKVRQIEESLLSLVEKYTSEKMTKKDLLGLLESPGTKEAPTKDPKTVPGKPERKTPYQPKHQPKPKARLPKELSFDELNITFKDEKKD